MSRGVCVALVEQVVKACGSLQPSENIFSKHRGVCDEEPSDERLFWRLSSTDFLPFEAGKKHLGFQRSDDIDLCQVSRGIAQVGVGQMAARILYRVGEPPSHPLGLFSVTWNSKPLPFTWSKFEKLMSPVLGSVVCVIKSPILL